MSITWQKVKAGTALLLGALEGVDVSTADTNYQAALSTSNTRDPNFPPTAILDACVDAVMQIAQAICESDDHPETPSFYQDSSAITSGSAIPTVNSAGTVPRIGPIRRVKDNSDGKTLSQTEVNKVRDYNALSGSVFNNIPLYWYAVDGNTLEHTRTSVIVNFCGFSRATITANIGSTDVIPLNDQYERLIIMGAVSQLAQRESMFGELQQNANQEFQAGLNLIRGGPVKVQDDDANIQ